MHKLKVVLLFLLIFSFGSLSFANSASLLGNDERAVGLFPAEENDENAQKSKE